MFFDINSLDGHWQYIIQEFTGYSVPTKAGVPCPFCGGDDRFHYTNKHNNGTWLCRKCTPEGSDGIGFIARRINLDRKEVFKRIAQRYQYDAPAKETVEVTPRESFIKCEPLQKWDYHTLLNKEKKYSFKNVWAWFDEAGKFYGYVARMEFYSETEKRNVKIIWQIHYGHPEGQPEKIGWYQVAMNPKPLFGYLTEMGIDYEAGDIIIVEGEKTCEAAKDLLGEGFNILCTQGGASQVDVTDWKPVIDSNLDVYIWPDLDEAGFKYAEKIKEKIPRAKIFAKEDLENLGLKESEDAADIQSLSFSELKGLLNNAR